MPPASSGDIERTSRRAEKRRQLAGPPDDERRRWIIAQAIGHTDSLAQALLTAIGISVLGLVATAIFGLTGTDLSRHIQFGIFSTLLMLLAHSMMMFYLIGKGKAVKDALVEGGCLPTDPRYRAFVRRISLARKPVFSIGTLAMTITMAAAIMGAGVDTGSLPPIIHGMIAYGGIASNLAAVKIEIHAIRESSRVVDEVNRLLLAS